MLEEDKPFLLRWQNFRGELVNFHEVITMFRENLMVPSHHPIPKCSSKVHRVHIVLRTTRFAWHQFDLRYEVLDAGVTSFRMKKNPPPGGWIWKAGHFFLKWKAYPKKMVDSMFQLVSVPFLLIDIFGRWLDSEDMLHQTWTTPTPSQVVSWTSSYQLCLHEALEITS